jgi:integrase/recombinase XerD
MPYIVDGDIALSQPPTGPLAAEIARFAEWARAQGYAQPSRHRQVLLAACFSQWLGHQGIRRGRITAEEVVGYLRCRARRVKRHRGDAASLRQFLEVLRHEGVIPPVTVPRGGRSPVDRETQAFETYLRHERVLAEATIAYYVTFVHDFLADRFGRDRVTLARLCAGDVVRFVQRQATRLHVQRAKQLTTALRSFLHYARYRGDIVLDLAAAVPTVASWSMSSIPRAIPVDTVRQLLASINRRTAVGRRNYALVLVLARLGLRASEVVHLELDDIDWDAGQVSVRGKGGYQAALPLPADVGAAMAAYLSHGRPPSTCRRVFVRARAPLCGFKGASAVDSIVRDALARAGLHAPTTGAHQFRHGVATQMLRHGASLTEIGELLRHRSPETTKIYAKVDVDALRTLALPWPGGGR